jgi:hypothetical protein
MPGGVLFFATRVALRYSIGMSAIFIVIVELKGKTYAESKVRRATKPGTG